MDYIGYWKLDGNTTDTSINQIVGNPSSDLNYSDGIAGQSAYFDGTGSDYINLGDHPMLDINKSITVSAWIKL